MNQDVILNKKLIIERSIKQAKSYYAEKSNIDFEDDYLIQDAIAINIQRACEAVIDIANHIVKNKKLGLPTSSRESFELLYQANIIDEENLNDLKSMIGFRNILIHNDQKLEIDILENIIKNHLDSLNDFAIKILQ